MNELLKKKIVRVMNSPAFWCNPFTGDCLSPDNTLSQIEEPESVIDILDWVISHSQVQKVLLYLAAGTILDERPDVGFFDTTGTSWERTMFSWEKLDGTYCQGDREIKLIGTGEYFGYDPGDTLVDLKQARTTLEHLIEETFKDVCSSGRVRDFQFHLMYTPSASGRELLAGSLPAIQTYPVLAEDITTWIVEHFGQARIETFAPAIPIVVDGPYDIDERWAYAACTDFLPLGDPLHDTENKQLLKVNSTGHVYPAMPGFYRLETRVPADWHHIGLAKASLLSEELGHSVYPSDPGTRFEACVTADELAMLAEQRWKYRILERVVFPDTEKYKQPFARWNTRFIELREQAEHNQYASLLKNAIRAIHLHTIGSLWRGYDYIYHETPLDDLPLPDNVVVQPLTDFEDYERELYCWNERVPLSPARRMFYQPHWPATIWGKARRRLTEFALKLPYESIIYLNTDGILTTEVPSWLEKLDTGKPGSFRLKNHIPGPWQWPDSSQSMRAWKLDYNEQRRLRHG